MVFVASSRLALNTPKRLLISTVLLAVYSLGVGAFSAVTPGTRVARIRFPISLFFHRSSDGGWLSVYKNFLLWKSVYGFILNLIVSTFLTNTGGLLPGVSFARDI